MFKPKTLNDLRPLFEKEGGGSGDENLKFSQEYVTELREENKSWRLKHKELETKIEDINKSILETADKKKIENEEFKTLADERATKIEELNLQITELNPYKEKLETYQENRKKQILDSIEDADVNGAKFVCTFPTTPADIRQAAQ